MEIIDGVAASSIKIYLIILDMIGLQAAEAITKSHAYTQGVQPKLPRLKQYRLRPPNFSEIRTHAREEARKNQGASTTITSI